MNTNQFLRERRKQEQSVYLRLLSVIHDSEYIDTIIDLYPELPVIANLRCGLWYRPNWDDQCYFKSADGHARHYKFNLHRLNPHIAIKAAENNGVLIIDSTRKGKRFPDSFTRTIPIWASVLNQYIALKKSYTDSIWKKLIVPDWIPNHEQELMRKVIPTFIDSLVGNETISQVLEDVLEKVKKPLRCFWVSPSYQSEVDRTLYTPILCISASMDQIDDTNLYPDWYIQGSADDEEMWSYGLTPKLFWDNKELILESENTCLEKVLKLVQENKLNTVNGSFELIGPIHNMYISSGKLERSMMDSFNAIVYCSYEDLEEREEDKDLIFCGKHKEEGDKSEEENNEKSDGYNNEDYSEKDKSDGYNIKEYNEGEGKASQNIVISTKRHFYKYIPIEKTRKDKLVMSRILEEYLNFMETCLLKHGIQSVMIHCPHDIMIPLCLGGSTLSVFYDERNERILEERNLNVTKDRLRNAMLYLRKYHSYQVHRYMLNDLNRYFQSPKEHLPKALLKK